MCDNNYSNENIGGWQFRPTFLSPDKAKALEAEIRKSKKEWLEVEDRTGKQYSLRSSLIGGYEIISSSNFQTKSDGTIPIKKLAEFAGVHPITITRNFAHTLSQSGGKSKKFSRATKETALALFKHISASNSSVTKEDLLNLFEKKK